MFVRCSRFESIASVRRRDVLDCVHTLEDHVRSLFRRTAHKRLKHEKDVIPIRESNHTRLRATATTRGEPTSPWTLVVVVIIRKALPSKVIHSTPAYQTY